MNGELKSVWKEMVMVSFKRMWEATKNLIIADSGLSGFYDII
jgi:hypothetical protein